MNHAAGTLKHALTYIAIHAQRRTAEGGGFDEGYEILGGGCSASSKTTRNLRSTFAIIASAARGSWRSHLALNGCALRKNVSSSEDNALVPGTISAIGIAYYRTLVHIFAVHLSAEAVEYNGNVVVGGISYKIRFEFDVTVH